MQWLDKSDLMVEMKLERDYIFFRIDTFVVAVESIQQGSRSGVITQKHSRVKICVRNFKPRGLFETRSLKVKKSRLKTVINLPIRIKLESSHEAGVLGIVT